MFVRWLCVASDPDYDPKQAKKSEKELKKMESKKDGTEEKKKHTFRGAAKAVSLAAKLSPKSQRKKEKMCANTAQLKVRGAGIPGLRVSVIIPGI